jgi:hypothetical protein
MKGMLSWATLLFKSNPHQIGFIIRDFSDFTLSWTSPSEQTTSAKKMEGKVSKAVELFVGRIRKMETDFVRYEMANDCGSHCSMIFLKLSPTLLL